MIPAGKQGSYKKEMPGLRPITLQSRMEYSLRPGQRRRWKNCRLICILPFTLNAKFKDYRRLLYVACTRAKCLLYLSHATTRMISGEDKATSISRFMATVRSNPQVRIEVRYSPRHLLTPVDSQTKGTFSEELPSLPRQDRVTMSQILNRELPDEADITRRVAD